MEQNPVFRKIIVAWYDSETACIIVIITMLLVLLFGIAGASVASAIPTYNDYIWLPVTLITLCTFIIFSAVFRLMRLYSD